MYTQSEAKRSQRENRNLRAKLGVTDGKSYSMWRVVLSRTLEGQLQLVYRWKREKDKAISRSKNGKRQE